MSSCAVALERLVSPRSPGLRRLSQTAMPWQSDDRIIAQGSAGFQSHGARLSHSLFFAFLQERRSDELKMASNIGEDADDQCAI